MENDEFRDQVIQFWSSSIIKTVGTNPPVSATWVGKDSIRDALDPFMASQKNHALLPSGGGLDALKISDSVEPGCLEITVGETSAWVVKPRRLTLEHFPESPINSFFLLELEPLSPIPLDNPQPIEEARIMQELAETAPGDYRDRMVLDNGYIGHDESGYEIPLPTGSRSVCRWLNGKILLVAKRSIWNSAPGTYRGTHNEMDAGEIRRCITDALDIRVT